MPEAKPSLRVCFPLRLQRGGDTWWEYEEYQIQFQDVLMWRQAFHLPTAPGVTTPAVPSNQTRVQNRRQRVMIPSAPSGEARVDYDYQGPVQQPVSTPRSHWSDMSSDNAEQDNRQGSLLFHLSVSSQESQPINALQSNADHSASARSHDDSYPINEIISLYQAAGSPSVNSQPIQESRSVESIRPPQQCLQAQLSDANANHLSEGEAPEGHHQAQTLGILEGNIRPAPNRDYCGCLSTLFRAIQHTELVPGCVVRLGRSMTKIMCATPCLPPRRQSVRISARGWTALRRIILSGLTKADQAAFPAYTADQEALFWVLEDEGGCFTTLWRQNFEICSVSEATEALELMQARGWNDVIFVSYEDSPRGMRSWGSTREPIVFQWGQGMI